MEDSGLPNLKIELSVKSNKNYYCFGSEWFGVF